MEAKSNSKRRREVPKGSSGDSSPVPALRTPSDVITRVFSQLDCVDLIKCSLVCKQWCTDSADLRKIWKETAQTARAEIIEKIKEFQRRRSQETSIRPDLRAFISMQSVSPKEDHIGSLLGLKVGDSFQYRVELNLIGLHKNFEAGVSCKKLGDEPEMLKIATSVLATEKNDKMDPNYEVLIYSGAAEKKDEKSAVEQDQIAPKHVLSQALVRNMRERIKVRVIYGYSMGTRDGKVVMIYTYCGLYYVLGYEKVDVTERSVRYVFKLERVNRDIVVVPKIVCEMA